MASLPFVRRCRPHSAGHRALCFTPPPLQRVKKDTAENGGLEIEWIQLGGSFWGYTHVSWYYKALWVPVALLTLIPPPLLQTNGCALVRKVSLCVWRRELDLPLHFVHQYRKIAWLYAFILYITFIYFIYLFFSLMHLWFDSYIFFTFLSYLKGPPVMDVPWNVCHHTWRAHCLPLKRKE